MYSKNPSEQVDNSLIQINRVLKEPLSHHIHIMTINYWGHQNSRKLEYK